MTLEYHVRYTMLVIILVAAVSGLPLSDVGLAAEQHDQGVSHGAKGSDLLLPVASPPAVRSLSRI